MAWAVGWAVPFELHLMNVAVHPGHRRRGLARLLLTALFQEHRCGPSTAACLQQVLRQYTKHISSIRPRQSPRTLARLSRRSPPPPRRHGAELVVLEVRASNDPALRLYHSLGFERVGLRRRYYHDGEDAVLMTLALPAGHPPDVAAPQEAAGPAASQQPGQHPT